MEEIKKLKGKLIGFGERKRGKKEDGSEWVLWEYKISFDGKEKTLTGFYKCTELLGEEVEVEYKEVIDGDRKYNNLVSIEKAGEMKEAVEKANREYNIKDIKHIPNQSENPAFFGMVWNSTVNWIIAERRLKTERKLTVGVDESYNFDDNFETVFNHFWDKALKKRDEKLGY